jgi:DNA adenine methylase
MIGAAEYLSGVQKRLQKTVIENKDFESLIKTYDRQEALFYLDPPYHGTEKYYDNTFSKEDHYRLNLVLKQIKGKFILSYNDDDFIRNLYKDFNIESITRQNNLLMKNKHGDRQFQELIIKNY